MLEGDWKPWAGEPKPDIACLLAASLLITLRLELSTPCCCLARPFDMSDKSRSEQSSCLPFADVPFACMPSSASYAKMRS